MFHFTSDVANRIQGSTSLSEFPELLPALMHTVNITFCPFAAWLVGRLLPHRYAAIGKFLLKPKQRLFLRIPMLNPVHAIRQVNCVFVLLSRGSLVEWLSFVAAGYDFISSSTYPIYRICIFDLFFWFRSTGQLNSGAAYAASKAAINRLTVNWGCEWAKDGIRVNAVAPGATITPSTESVPR